MRADRLDDGPFLRRHRAEATARRLDQGALDHGWSAVLIQRGDQRLAHFQLRDRFFNVEIGVDAKGFRRRLDRPLVARSEGTKRVLHAVAQLACHFLGNIDGVLRHEIDAHALRTDQSHHSLDGVLQGVRRIVEQQVRLVEEEHQLRLLRVAHLRQAFEQFGQQPQQEGGIELGTAHQLFCRQHVHHAAPLLVDMQEIVDLQRRFAEEVVRALRFEAEELPLDRAHRLLRDVAVFAREFLRIVVGPSQHRAQILEIQQQQPVLIGVAKHDLQHAFLRLVQVQQAGEQQGPHFGHRGADRVPVLAVQVPEHHRVIGIGIVLHAQFPRPPFQLVSVLELGRSGHGDAGEVSLHIGHEDRHAGGGKAFRHALQGHCLAGAGGACDQTVAVGARKIE